MHILLRYNPWGAKKKGILHNPQALLIPIRGKEISYWKKTPVKARVAQHYIEPDPKGKAGKKGDGICDFRYCFSPSSRRKIM